MADSLFDKRYRYDHIYPRGRSGETLRAVDTADNDRPVVIKRPAALDAPPIRAGQEVSIANERRALKALAGHPVLAALVGEGQFMVGGTAHQYIAMERAQGIVVADAVLELNAIGERLPMLEILVIVDNLLDILALAHSKGIVYNDVDAKHLFWERDGYGLKVIDWGNAVFLEGDEMTPQGISRQTDVHQMGQLLYYLVTGGRRPDVPRDAGADFALDFGEDTRRVHPRIQEIISRALHPSLKLRYLSLSDLRNDLAIFRQPLERERNASVSSVNDRLKKDDLSKNDLRILKTTLDTALQQDPGYPPAREALANIQDRLRDLAVEADLDAARIYIETGSWARARDLLVQVRDKAGSQTSALINFLLDTSELLLEHNTATTPTIQKALNEVSKGQATQAAKMLLLEIPPTPEATQLQWLIAERISSHFPDAMLLRPNLYRLMSALDQLEQQGYDAPEPRRMLASVEKTLDTLAAGNIDLPGLRDGYSSVVEQLSVVNPIMQTFAFQHQFTNRQLSLNTLDRALNAAMALADAMHVIGRQATASPRDALNALDTSRAIDPTNPVWDDVEYLLNKLYERLQAYQTYVPSSDGTDLQAWLKTTQSELAPFVSRLFDDLLARFVRDLEFTSKIWESYRDAILKGDRDTVLAALDDAARAVNMISPTLSAWFRHLRVVVEGASYIERHSIPNGIGRAIADGWEAFDRGKLVEAEKLAQQAYEVAKTPTEYEVAQRLQDVATLMREWVERNGVNNAARTQTLLGEIEKRFTPAEKILLDQFTAQMPSVETYLKAMTRGLIEVYSRSGTAAIRLLFAKYVLLSTLEVHENRLSDGDFWREAAVRTLGEHGAKHPALRTLDEFVARKKDFNAAQALFGRLNGKHALPELESIRRQLDANAQGKLLASGVQSIRDLELALRDWSDGDFRNAGLKLETVTKGINDLEKTAAFKLPGYRAWIMELMASDAELLVQFREARGIIEQRPDEPDARVYEAFHDMARVTTRMLGEDYAGTLRSWRDTYDQFLGVFTAEERRSRRMERMNELFRAMFIDRHPAYGLYRHWYDVLERSPEFPAPPTSDPTPRINDSHAASDDFIGSKYAEDSTPNTGRSVRRLALVGVPLVIILAIGGGLVMAVLTRPNTTEIAVTISATPSEPIIIVTGEATAEVVPVNAPTSRPTATLPIPATNTPPPTATTAVPTASPTQATATTAPTDTPSQTWTPSVTPTRAPATLTPLPAGGITGTVELIALLNSAPADTLDAEVFIPLDSGYRLGRGTLGEDDLINVVIPADLLNTTYGSNAPARIRRMDVEMSLRTINPAIVGENDVYFGALLQSLDGNDSIGIRIEVVNQSAINLYRVENGVTTFLSQKSINAVIVRLRIERDLAGSVSLFYNDEPLGDPVIFLTGDASVLPVVSVRDGGVIIGVTNWRVTLR